MWGTSQPWRTDSKGNRRKSCAALLQYSSSPWLWSIHLLHDRSSFCQHDCPHHADSRDQQVPDATSVWRQQELHLGIDTWHHCHGCPTDPSRGQNQTGQLDLSQGSSTVRSSNIWCVLPWKTSGQQWQHHSTMGPAKELLCSADKKGKGQQEIIIGAMYHGAYEHRSFQAGGNEKAQLRVADLGVVTTSEKHTIANSHNVGLKFVAMKWENLTVRPNPTGKKLDHGASSDDDCTYWAIEERRPRQRHRG